MSGGERESAGAPGKPSDAGADSGGAGGAGAATPRLPAAVLRPEGRLSPVWIVPLAALLLATWLAVVAWRQRGLTVTVHLPEGYGLKVGDPVRYRGITVGEVTRARLADDLHGVVITVSLHEQADRLARAGARFWVVHPRLGVTRIEGLETLLGPRYLGVAPPDDGESRGRRREFVGLPDPPAVESIEPGDLEIVLEAERRGSVRPGAPVTFRQIRVGTVLSVGLASDGSAVEARVHVEKAYRQLVRANTRFWDAGGLRANAGLAGVSVEIDSLERLIAGGIALATPPPESAGDEVRTGHRFPLAAEPEDEWLEWKPVAAIGSALLPAGARLPQPLRATIGWKQGFILKGQHSRTGWVLQTAGGLLGPADLLRPELGRTADRETVALEVAGIAVPLASEAAPAGRGLARLDVEVTESRWPAGRMRAASTPEDAIAVGDPAASPVPLAASRLTLDESPEGRRWIVDPAVSFDQSWHGACVLARSDGKLLGMLLVGEDDVSVGLVEEGTKGPRD